LNVLKISPKHQAGRVAVIIGLVVALVATTASVALRLAEQIGRLSVPPLYDDVVYFLAAAQWLNAASGHGIAANLYGLLHQHAPFSTLMAIIGFSLPFRGHLGPYAINVVVIAAFLFGIARLVWARPLVDIATALVGAASVPVFWQTMTEARPDLPWGLALGLAAGAVLTRPLLPRSRWSIFGLGVLCGLASAIKPSAFPASFACLGLIAAARMAQECTEGGGVTFRAMVTRVRPAALLFAAGLLAGAIPIIGLRLLRTIRYILNVIIYERDFWVYDESFGASLQHYAVGIEGQVALGGWLWAGLALMIARLCFALLNDRRDLGPTMVVLTAGLIAFAIPTLSNVKSYFLGAMFYGVFIVTMALNFAAVVAGIDRVLARLTERPAWRRALGHGLHVIPLTIVAALFVTNCFPGQVVLPTGLTPDQIHDIRSGTDKVWSLLQQKSLLQGRQAGKVPEVSFSSPYPVTPITIELYAAQSGMPLGVKPEFFRRTTDATEKVLIDSDLAIITSTMPHNLPGPRQGDELIGRFDANPDMCLVAALPLRTVREIRVYRHRRSGCDAPPPDKR
jgi:hypothetical protein